MARIRSMHPGLFTDEAFVSCSPLARLLLLGIWTDADDHGVFDWKPVTLKMRLLAAEIAETNELLGELTAFDLVRKVEIAGKPYGLVRNFCIWQRPKKPTYRVELPQEFWKYAGLKADGSRPNAQASATTSPEVPHQSTTGTTVRPQRKEEGGRSRRKEESKSIDKTVVVVVPPAPEAPAGTTTTTKVENDLVVQEPSPKQPSNPLGTVLPETWVPDEACLTVAFEHGMSEADIESEVLRFHALNAQRGTFSQNWSKTWTLWCAEFKRRATKEAAKAPARVELSAPYAPTIEEWEKAVARWKSNNSHWSRQFGPEPGMTGCRCPRPLLIAHGIDPATGRALTSQEPA